MIDLTLDDSTTARVRRRLVTITSYVLALAALLAMGPLLLPAAMVVDVVRGSRFAVTRLLLFAIVFFTAEIVALAIAAVGTAWHSRERHFAWHAKLQILWARALFAAARRLFVLQVDVEGDDAVSGGPLVVLSRHASIVDTLLPAVLLTHRHGLFLRYVLKSELLIDPCLDVVGHRLPNVFVRRGSDDSNHEIARIRALAEGVGRHEGILIYPEGTRFTATKLARALERTAAMDPHRHDRVRSFTHVLPPRVGGAFALVDTCRDADILFLGHAGLETATTLREVTRGALVGCAVRVVFWRVPACEVPRDHAGFVHWLDGEWARMNQWVARTNRTA